MWSTCWVNRVYRKAGLGQERAWVLIVPAGLSGGRKELIVPVPGYWVSTAACRCLSWLSVMGHLSQPANRLLRK